MNAQNLSKTTKAYKEIFKVLEKHKDSVVFNINNLKDRAELHLWGLKLKEVYGLNIDLKDITSKEWCRISEYIKIGYFSCNNGSQISWEDNGNQPLDEHLLIFSFPTGAYALGDKYPIKLFKEFFEELKTYNPKYCDTNNSTLYFSLDKAKDVFNNFDEIFAKYKYRYNKSAKQREIEELETKLNALKNSKN
jgi:hypothetical protein